MRKFALVCTLGGALFLPTLGFADNAGNTQKKTVLSDVDVSLGGWARLDYGYGEDRYGEEGGDDQLGISKVAFITKAAYENFSFVGVIGGSVVSHQDSDIGIKDAFIIWDKIGGSSVKAIGGAQPILFGLKPNGYPGDRSIVPSIEFGGAGGFAVSNQGGAAARVITPVAENVSLELGAFDTSESTAAYVEDSGLGDVDGSAVYKNGLVQVRLDDMGGFYGSAGAEGRYVGGETDSTEPIFDIGAGYKNDLFDLSGEWIHLAQEVAGTADDEQYLVIEATLTPIENYAFILDWSYADELDVSTLRVGVHYDINKHVEARLEYAGDLYGSDNDQDDVHSVDARLTFSM